MYKIPFQKTFFTGKEQNYITQSMSKSVEGDHSYFIRKAKSTLTQLTGQEHVLITSSCTDALEMAALLCQIGPGDEVIMPSFTFVTAANAFVLRGATIVFVDVDPDTMNISHKTIESALTPKTKAILVMHYGGIACDMDPIMQLAETHQILVIEDAAHCIGATYKGRHLGTIGHIGTLSFHHTKNVHCMEGGALIVNHLPFWERANILYEKGTNRHQFLNGMASYYTWVDLGSSFTISDLGAACLVAQLEALETVTNHRLSLHAQYTAILSPLQDQGKIALQIQPKFASGNAHIFYLKCRTLHRDNLINQLNNVGIQTCFHYAPLHQAEPSKKHGRFHGTDQYTSIGSDTLLRLPIYPDLSIEQSIFIGESIAQIITNTLKV